MNIQQAKEELRHIGLDYFYDELDRLTIEEITYRISEDIARTSKFEGLYYWEVTRDAFNLAISDLHSKELDLMLEYFGLNPEQVGGSRAFFHRLATEMDKAIQEVKPKLTE